MLATNPTFPQPGSKALLGTDCVTIHQREAGGTFLVFGDRRTYRARFEELAPIPDDIHPVQLWLITRIDQRDPNARTGSYDAMEDFRLFCRAEGLDGAEANSQDRFRRAVKAAGGKFVMKSEKVWGRWHRTLHLAGRIRGAAQ